MPGDDSNAPLLRLTDLPRTGHLLLMGHRPPIDRVILELCKPMTLSLFMAVFDFTPQKLLENLCKDEDRIYYCIPTLDQAKQALDELRRLLDHRKTHPTTTPGTWVLFIDGLEENNWEMFLPFLQDGKAARMYVIGATRHLLTTGPMHKAFDTIMIATSASEDHS